MAQKITLQSQTFQIKDNEKDNLLAPSQKITTIFAPKFCSRAK